MSKFENKVQNMDTVVLKALQDDLAKKIAREKIGFGKRALHLLTGVLAGTAVTAAGMHTAAKRYGFEDFPDAIDGLGDAVGGTRSRDDGVSRWAHMKENSPAELNFGKMAVASAVVGLGALIGSAVLLNRSSKRANDKKLSFVNAELERRGAMVYPKSEGMSHAEHITQRREAAEQEVGEPQNTR